MGRPTLKPQSNGPLYNNWFWYSDWYLVHHGRWRAGCYIWYNEDGHGRAAASNTQIYMYVRSRFEQDVKIKKNKRLRRLAK